VSRVSILTRVIDIANLSVRPSVRYVPVSDEHGLTYRHSFFTIGNPIILVLSASNIFTKFRRGHPCGGAKYRWGIKISTSASEWSHFYRASAVRGWWFNTSDDVLVDSPKWHFTNSVPYCRTVSFVCKWRSRLARRGCSRNKYVIVWRHWRRPTRRMTSCVTSHVTRSALPSTSQIKPAYNSQSRYVRDLTR